MSLYWKNNSHIWQFSISTTKESSRASMWKTTLNMPRPYMKSRLYCKSSNNISCWQDEHNFFFFAFFIARWEIWREAVFKLTDCPRNIGNSAIPPDKEDLVSIFVQKNATSISHPISVQDNKKEKGKKTKHYNISCLSRFPFQLNPKGLPSLPSGKKKTSWRTRRHLGMAFRFHSPWMEK